jgi:lipid-A-disaccharide synthase
VSKKKIKVGIIAAEHSGDRLGSKILKSLQNIFEVDLYGLGGPEVNTSSIVTPPEIDYQDLHVMGLIDPLINLPKILSIRKKLLNLFIANDIDIFIGVDSPDFNMFFHKKLKQKNIKTIQVVSPSVWGWRENRIKSIKAYVDLTMCLFKFECNFYNKKNMHSFFLGHPFSQLKPTNKEEVIAKHSLDSSKDFISILPGSRISEISHLMPVYVAAAKKLLNLNSNAFFLIPAANKQLAEMIQSTKGINEIPCKLSIDSAQDFLSLSSISIVTSGTASLEAAVLGSVPIICYKTNKLNYAILSRLVRTPFVGLPNLLLQEHIFPELIQYDLTPESIINSFSKISSEPEHYNSYLTKINDSMRGEGFEVAAKAINNLL